MRYRNHTVIFIKNREVCETPKRYVQDRPELVCQRRSEVVDFSGVLEAILKRLEIVVHLSTCLVSRQVKIGPILPQARAAQNCFHIKLMILMDSSEGLQ